ncbi:hypothetical protein [uncultured Polaribacter sp.]|uniref:hypothetical protein n=1 Tax=uncultured Polaribacter sp. TaxID=174711 RepID=UPI0026200CE1|nr:hypothetical protein [uncultured Polaribacter sp.]
MKKIVSFLMFSFLVLISVKGLAQSSKEKVNTLAKQMFVDMNNRDYEAVLAMTHPKVFEFASKEQIKTALKIVFEGNSEYSVEISNSIPDFEVSEIFTGDNNLECGFVVYDLGMKMTFHNQKFDEATKNMMITTMKAKEMDVTFTSDNSMNISMKNKITAILKEEATNNEWVMVNYDPYSPLFGKILSPKVLEEVKAYKEKLLFNK